MEKLRKRYISVHSVFDVLVVAEFFRERAKFGSIAVLGDISNVLSSSAFSRFPVSLV